MKIIVFGTRPEFIKILPLIWELERRKIRNRYYFLFSGQQEHLISDLMEYFNFKPDEIIPYKDHNCSLSDSATHLLHEVNSRISLLRKKLDIKMIIAQGDTTTSVCASLTAFLNKIPFAHIEAGLRTQITEDPWPEEYFRKVIALSAKLHFAPTQIAKQNLIDEGVKRSKIIVTGNTIVDFLNEYLSKLAKRPKKKLQILITLHRRDNQHQVASDLLNQIKILAKEFPEYKFIWVKHPAMERQQFYKSSTESQNFITIPPVPVIEFYNLLMESKLVISDSGGIQEECPSFNTPVLVVRKYTERTESIDLGYSILIKNVARDLRKNFIYLINSKEIKMKNPYGDGKTSQRIIEVLESDSDF